MRSFVFLGAGRPLRVDFPPRSVTWFTRGAKYEPFEFGIPGLQVRE